MRRSRRARRERSSHARGARGRSAADLILDSPEPTVRRATLWLALAFLVPNLPSLACAFLYDDLPLIIQNDRLHALATLPQVFTHGYWPDRPGLTLYRPVTQFLWGLLWAGSGARPLLFHAANLALGTIAVLLIYRLLLALAVPARHAFLATLLFALLPIHTEATTPAVALSEPLAAALSVGALLCYLRGRRLAALGLFVLAVLSKESAAAMAGVALVVPFILPASRARPPVRRLAVDAAAAGAVIALALAARALVAEGPVFVPPIDNPMSLVGPLERVLTALWIQILYVQRTFVPVVLSADYSYSQIKLVMGLGDLRAWAGLAFAGLAVWAFWTRPQLRLGILFWVVLFAPAANVVFAIGTMMGERLAYLPSIGLCLLAAPLLMKLPRRMLVPATAAIVIVLAARTTVRVFDWRDADAFYPKLALTSPGSAKSHYFLGCWRSARGDDAGALAAYDEAVRIFPAYPEAFNNRGGTLVLLGRLEEAKESYRLALRFDPGHQGAAASLAALEAGIPFTPKRPKV